LYLAGKGSRRSWKIRRFFLLLRTKRAADFYGPNTQNGVPNVLVFELFAKGAKASWLDNAAVPHSLTFTPDAARGVAVLADQESA
jgi:hypothetical protein